MDSPKSSNIQSASLNDPAFPVGIAQTLERAGLGLNYHWQGPLQLCAAGPRIGMIGTRKPDAESEAAMERLAAALSRRGAIIVSGAAVGVDIAAHRGALKENGSTIACVPFGLATTDLATWRDGLLDPASGRALVISALQPHQQVTTKTPILRNRLIAALSQVVVVGEAGLGSGTHHCRRFAEKLHARFFFLTGFAGNDKQLLAMQEGWRKRGAIPFTKDQAGDDALVEAIIGAAKSFEEQEAASRAAQLKLFPSS